MIAAALLLVQAAAGPPVPLDLKVAVRRPCPENGDGGDIVVCATPDQSPRLAPLPQGVELTPSDPMAFRLPGGGKGRVEAIQRSVGGFTSTGAAVTLRLPFGKGKKE